jgi:hypothetical protein
LSPLPDWKGNVLADPSQSACLEKFHLHRVPHTLSINQKSDLSIAPGILKLIAKDGEEANNLEIASGSGIVCQAAKNGSCITGRQLLGEAGINEIKGSWGRAWVDLWGHLCLVLADTFNGLSALHPFWGLHPVWTIYQRGEK